MTDAQLLEAFLDLARELALEVRVVGSRAARSGLDSESPPASALCRVKGQLWVVLSAADPASEQIDLLARALQIHAGAALEERHLAPALRQRLDRAAAGVRGKGESGAG